MNIFFLDPDPKLAAQYHCDKHVVKMIVETAQLLCTAHRLRDMSHEINGVQLYKATHTGHPCGVWVRSSSFNYLWAYSLFRELGDEYTHRYGRSHATIDKFVKLLLVVPARVYSVPFTAPPQCMPDKYKIEHDPVEAYRAYYRGDKARFAKWSRRGPPEWWAK